MLLKDFIFKKIENSFAGNDIVLWKENTFKTFEHTITTEKFSEIGYIKSIRSHYHIQKVNDKEFLVSVMSGVWIDLDKKRKNKSFNREDVNMFYLKSVAKVKIEDFIDFIVMNSNLQEESEDYFVNECSKKDFTNKVLKHIKLSNLKWKHREEKLKLSKSFKNSVFRYLDI